MASKVVEETPDPDQEVAVEEILADVEEAIHHLLHAIARDLLAEATVEETLKEVIEELQLTTKPDTEDFRVHQSKLLIQKP